MIRTRRLFVLLAAGVLAGAPGLPAQASPANPFASPGMERQQDYRRMRRHRHRLELRGERWERHGMRLERRGQVPHGRRWERRGDRLERRGEQVAPRRERFERRASVSSVALNDLSGGPNASSGEANDSAAMIGAVTGAIGCDLSGVTTAGRRAACVAAGCTTAGSSAPGESPPPGPTR